MITIINQNLKNIKSILLADKVVKFNNQTYPKFGWCLTLVGGSGSGKTTQFNNNIMFEGHIFNVDNIMTIFAKHFDEMVNRMDEDKKIEILKMFDNKKPNLNNSNDLNILYNLMRKPTKWDHQNKYSKSVKTFFNALTDNLPNIVFDITGQGFFNSSANYNIQTAYRLGYKTSLVWVITSIENAIERNKNRNRNVKEHKVIQTFKSAYYNMISILNGEQSIPELNEFWVLFSDEGVISERIKDMKDYKRSSETCFLIPKKNNYFIADDNLINKINNIVKI